MRYSLVAIAATALLGSVSARHSHRRHAHAAHIDLAPREVVPEVVPDECACSTYVTTYLVAITPTPEPIIVSDATTTVQAVKTVVPIGEVDATKSIPPAEGSGAPGSSVPGVGEGDAPSSLAGVPSSTGVPAIEVPSAGVPSPDSPTDVPAVDDYTTTVSSTITHTATSTSLTYITTQSSAVKAVSSVSDVPSVPAVTPAEPVPTQQVTTIATPGVYTIPATTITLTSTEVVCVPETTSLPAGQQTYGGVTTIVETSTTVVCPLATVEVDDGVTTSKIYTTTYICPTPGTYTIGATTTDVPAPTTVEYPVPTAYTPGTYVQPEITTTITVTSQVVTCPLFTAAPTSDATSTPVAAVPTTPAAPSVPTSSADSTAPSVSSVEVPSVSSVDVPSVSSVEATVIPSSPVSSAAPAASSAVGEIPSSGGLWAITYSPYANGGGCKTAEEVEADVASIASKGFQNIRIYSTDCSGLGNVAGSAEKHGLGLILGVFLKAGCGTTGADQVKDIIAWGKWDMVVLIVVGNEAVFNGYCSASDLATYISTVTSEFKNAGYTGPVTTTEPLNILQSYGASNLCSVMDIIGVNIHPFFNAGTAAVDAGTFLTSQVALTEEVCTGKQAWVLECGWPSSGNSNGLAVAGVAEQAIAVTAMVAALPGRVAYFTFTDDYWKAPGAYNVEQHFGLAQLFAS